LAAPADGPYLAAIATLVGKAIPEITLADIDGAALDPAKSRRRGGSRRATAAKRSRTPKTDAQTKAEKPSKGANKPRHGAAKPAKGGKAKGPDSPGDAGSGWGGDSPVPAFLTRPVRGVRDKGG